MDNTPNSGPPIHIIAILVTIALDSVWSLSEVVALSSIGGVPAVPIIIASTGIICFLAVMVIQKFVGEDTWGASFAKGFGMGVIAGVPFPFTGTLAGGILLSWVGISWLRSKRLPPPNKKLLDSVNKKTK